MNSETSRRSPHPPLPARLFYSLQLRLTLMTSGLFVAGFWIAALLMIRHQEQQLHDMLAFQQQATARYVAREIDGKIQVRLDSLAMIAARIPTPIEDLARLDAYLLERRAIYKLCDFGLVVTKPDLSAAYSDLPALPGRRIGNWRLSPFEDVVRTGKAAVGAPRIGRYSKRPVVPMAVPINDDHGQLRGILACITSIDAPYFLEPITHYQQAQGGNIEIVAPASGLVLAESERHNQLKPLSPTGTVPLYDHLIAREGSLVGLDAQGVEVLASSQRIPASGWFVIARQRTAVAFAPVRAQQALVLAGAGLLSLIVGLLTALLVRQSLLPIKRLATLLDAMSRGTISLYALPVVQQDEVGMLVDSFNRLHASLLREQAAQRESEEHLRTLIEAIPEAIQFKDRDGRWLAFNRTAQSAFGLEQVDCLGKSDAQLAALAPPIFRDSLLRCRDTDEAVWQAGQLARVEEVIARPDTPTLIFDVIKVPLFEPDGTRKGLVIVARDITQRRETEAALREKDEKLRALFDLSPLGIALTDMGGRYIEFNEAFRRICGYPLDELNTLDYWTLTPKKYEALEREQLDSLERTGYYGPYEKEYRRKDGSLVPLRLNGMLLTGSDGQHYIWSIVEDITQQKAAAATIQNLNADLTATLQAVPDLLFDLDRNGTYLGIWAQNPALLADQKEALLGHTVADRLPAEAAETVMAAIGEADEKGYSYGKTICLELADETRWFELSTAKKAGTDGAASRFIMLSRDISERQRTTQELALLNFAMNHVDEAAFLADEQGRFQYVNDDACRNLRRSRDELLGLRVIDVDTVTTRQEQWTAFWEQIKGQKAATFESRHGKPDGRDFPVELNVNYFEFLGKPYVLGLSRDITERKRVEEKIRLAASVFANSYDGVIITDARNIILDVNPAFTRITGYTREETIGKGPGFLSSGRQKDPFYASLWNSLHEHDFWQGEIWNRRKSGEVYAEMLAISVVRDEAERLQHYIGVFTDISQIKSHEAELDHIAHYDALTGVPNRRLLADRLDQAISHAQRSEKSLALCYLDLDGFKPVNDQYGHAVGDDLLVEITARLKQILRAEDTLARLGGDEFVLIFTDLAQPEEIHSVLDRVLTAVSAPMLIEGNTPIGVSASVGVTLYPEDNTDADTLLSHADHAMYFAKEAGKNQYSFFNPDHKRR